ncbi:ligand-gated channel protein [Vreelandella nigrificans]|uniref:Ligand-gated channel protein n=1 Tax=Vreelandella nigrificans TaxID=2042704 RepID=A0A2A4HRP3_9GAMM|nr:ligand-gated channel protein [Halomonas nigrificans]PCF97087.1 ligand-gated channel protein [Halomonas nigrificans]
MSLCFRRKLLASVVSTLASGGVWAQETPRLDDMVVTASGFEQQVANAPASISVATREQLEKGYYRDVTDALRDMPGVIVTGGGGGDNGYDISLRGMPAQYTLILVDGRPRSSRDSRPNGSAGFEQDWLPPLQAIDRIEVVRGPMATLYGSDAIGGVINIITRRVADEWSGNLQLDTVIQESSSSGDSRDANFYLSGPLVSDQLGLQLYGRTSQRDEDDIVSGYNDKSLQSLTGRLTWTPSQQHDISLEAGYTDQERSSTPGRSVEVTDAESNSKHNSRHLALTHSGRFDIGTTETFVQRESTENVARDITITNTTAKTSLVMPLGVHMVTIGASYEDESLEDTTTNSISADVTNLDNSSWAVFLEDEWYLTDTWSLTGGVRVDESEDYGSHVSPRLYSVWNFSPAWTIKGGVSTGYRAPTLRETSPDWGAVSRGGNIYGNPDLKPETSLNKELGVLYDSGQRISGSFTVFHNDFEDKITRVSCPIDICSAGPNQFGSDPTTYRNVDEAVTQGVEMSLAAELMDNVSLRSSYTYTDSEQKSGEYAGQPLTKLPRHQLSTTLDWQVTPELTQWTRVSYRGKESQPTGGRSSSTIVAPSYTFVDAGIGYRLTPSATINAGIYNLFDEEITYDEYGYIEDGRRVWLGLNVSF